MMNVLVKRDAKAMEMIQKVAKAWIGIGEAAAMVAERWKDHHPYGMVSVDYYGFSAIKCDISWCPRDGAEDQFFDVSLIKAYSYPIQKAIAVEQETGLKVQPCERSVSLEEAERGPYTMERLTTIANAIGITEDLQDAVLRQHMKQFLFNLIVHARDVLRMAPMQNAFEVLEDVRKAGGIHGRPDRENALAQFTALLDLTFRGCTDNQQVAARVVDSYFATPHRDEMALTNVSAIIPEGTVTLSFWPTVSVSGDAASITGPSNSASIRINAPRQFSTSVYDAWCGIYAALNRTRASLGMQPDPEEDYYRQHAVRDVPVAN